jgi:hypothetical protein
MVGWLHRGEGRLWRPRVTQTAVLGLSLLEVTLPPGGGERRLFQGAKALRRQGVRRVLLDPDLAMAGERALLCQGLHPVDPLPLCLALGPQLALTLLEEVPLRRRRVALRGEEAGAAWPLAYALCPQVGTLLLDFDRGEEALCRRLWTAYGASPLHLGQGPPPQVSLELSCREAPAGTTLRLWGQPDLGGLTVCLPGDLPAGLPPLAFGCLLWETGRMDTAKFKICRNI